MRPEIPNNRSSSTVTRAVRRALSALVAAVLHGVCVLPVAGQWTVKPPGGLQQDNGPTLSPEDAARVARANALFVRVGTLSGQGKYAEALPLAEEQAGIVKSFVGADDPRYAGCIHIVAVLKSSLGDDAQAVPLFSRAVAIYEHAGEKKEGYASSLGSLAMIWARGGDFERAEPVAVRVCEIFLKEQGPNGSDYITAVTVLGLLYLEKGDTAKAAAMLEKALTLQKRAVGTGDPAYAAIAQRLATLYQATGQHERAEALSREADRVFSAHPGDGDYLAGKLRWAETFIQKGETGRARPMLEALSKTIGHHHGTAHPLYLNCVQDVAATYYIEGDFAKAQDLLEKSLAAEERVLGKDHPEYVSGLHNLVNVCVAGGNYAKGAAVSAEVLARTRRQADRTALCESERQQLLTDVRARERLGEYLGFSLLAKTDADEVYRNIAGWKGSVHERQRRARQLVRELEDDGVPTSSSRLEVKETCRQLAAAVRRLAELTTATADNENRGAQITAQAEEIDRLQAKLAGSADGMEVAGDRPKGTNGMGGSSRTAMVDLYVYERHVPRRSKSEKDETTTQLVAFIVRPGAPTARVELGPLEPVVRAVETWRESLGASAAGLAAARELRRLVWTPLTSFLKGADTVLVSPDGPLWELPFGALPGPEEGSYLVETVAIVLLPTPGANAASAKTPANTASSLLLVGDVDFGKADRPAEEPGLAGNVPRGLAGVRWQPLVGTSVEMAAVRRLFEQSFPSGHVDQLSGSDASKAAVCLSAPGHQVLHIATHGYFASERSPAAADASRLRFQGFAPRAGREADLYPGLLSGLVFAGANRGSVGFDRSVLTALEAQEFDLSGVSLVVLSACETGLGASHTGEGLLGLQRAFQVAGARTVVGALWSVDDAATQLMMSHFYENLWVKKLGPAESLREAQLWMIRNGARFLRGEKRGLVRPSGGEELEVGGKLAPRYWASFVVSGSGP